MLSGGFSMLVRGRTTGLRGWPGSSAIGARLSGRYSSGMASQDAAAAASGAATGATSGHSQARCCTWTPSACSRFREPGHWATGDRTELARNRGAGYLYAHCVIDDHSRLAYVELHSRDSSEAAAATLKRAAAWMAEQGCGPIEAVMTDNALVYRRSNQFARTLRELGAKHIRTPPYTPRWNGKAERFIQTLDTEWAHGRVWPNSTTRDRALRSWLRYYNRRRPHTSLADRPPTSRVHQDRGQNS